MASTFTTNIGLEKPANGDDVDTWDVPVNSNSDTLDVLAGNVTTLTVTSASGTVNLVAAQYVPRVMRAVGTQTANIVYQLPTGVGGTWIFDNQGTGSSAFTITLKSGGGGTTVIAPKGSSVIFSSDGTNIVVAPSSLPGAIAGNEPPAGYVGEYLSSTSGPTAFTSGLILDACSILLTPGIWFLWGTTRWDMTSAGTFTHLFSGFNTVSATPPNWPAYSSWGITFAANQGQFFPIMPIRVNISANTTYYMVTNGSFSAGTAQVSGFAAAMRVA